VSLVIEDGDRVLLVRRPDDDADLPGVWGLPAASLTNGESPEDAVRRAGREKLGVEVRPLEPLGQDGSMTDFRAEIVTGEPAVPQPGPHTQYAELRWGELADLLPAARRGSLCSRVLLRTRGVEW
jgi:ADP-ribose pyrophosphatase YjhB (NUDIX family)